MESTSWSGRPLSKPGTQFVFSLPCSQAARWLAWFPLDTIGWTAAMANTIFSSYNGESGKWKDNPNNEDICSMTFRSLCLVFTASSPSRCVSVSVLLLFFVVKVGEIMSCHQACPSGWDQHSQSRRCLWFLSMTIPLPVRAVRRSAKPFLTQHLLATNTVWNQRGFELALVGCWGFRQHQRKHAHGSARKEVHARMHMSKSTHASNCMCILAWAKNDEKMIMTTLVIL